jgi:hypothetical protein
MWLRLFCLTNFICHEHDTISLTEIPGEIMSELYRASNWAVDVRQLQHLQELHTLTVQYGGKFAILPAFDFREGLTVRDKLLICIDKDGWNKLIEQVINLGFSYWNEVVPDVFTDEFAFNPFKMSDYTRRTWEARLALAHQHNFSSKPQVHYYPEKPMAWEPPNSKAFNSLKHTGVVSLDDVLKMLSRGPDAELALRNFGEKSLDELIEKLREKGYLADD